ncbi:MAG: 23S rRNA (uracil-C(5))-methyltransferase RlmCD [Chlamydiae bacterium]|nr:23S rRNA (uracil-C(5))-methyltransferase RlmCD [Chlamydiota bacterium]
MSIRNQPHFVEIDIVKYSKKGNGIGYFERQDGTEWPVEVSFAVPGDKVRAMLLRKRRGIYQSRLEEILHPSSDRIPPRCKHFGLCGGCRWQQVSYEMQLKNKQEFVLRCFGDLLTDEVEVRGILPCASQWHYRNKMEYSFSSDAAKNNYLGLMMDASKGRVFHLSECHLPNPWFVEAVNAVRQWWNEFGLDAYHVRRNSGSLRTLTLREGQRTGDRMVNLTVSGNPAYALKKQHLESFVAFVRDAVEPVDPEKKLSIFLTIQQVQKGQPTQLYEMHLYGAEHIREILYIKTDPAEEPQPLKFSISPSAFFQPNTEQAELLYSIALRMGVIPKSAVVYDLYCGTGTLGICVANRAEQVVGIELSPESALDARSNASENGLDNVTILTGSVHEKLAEIQEEELFPPPDIVMVDPPRPGLDPASIKHIIALNPPKIIYISCNPATQAENIAEFVKAGYRLQAVQPVDQFPHTVHIENIAVLSK